MLREGDYLDLEMSRVFDGIEETNMLWSEVSCLFVKVVTFDKMGGFDSQAMQFHTN